MKKNLIVLLLALVNISVYAYDFETDGIYYNIVSENDRTCEVTYDPQHPYTGSLTIPASTIYDGISFKVIRIASYAISGNIDNKSVTSITIEPGLTNISDYAFAKCFQLSSVTIPSTVTTIGAYAFWQCNNLTSVNLPNGISTISDGTFNRCLKLTTITIPSSVTTIGREAFKESGLTSIDLPDNLESIGNEAFYLTWLTTITIPDGVDFIPESAFEDCYNLTSVISSRPISVGSLAFMSCTKLTDLPLISYIDQGGFSGCKSLTSINLSDNLTEIAGFAFHGCTNLSHISIPGGASLTGRLTFNRCSSLKSVYLHWTNPKSIDDSIFDECPDDMVIFIPRGSLSNYQTTPGWMKLKNFEEFDIDPATISSLKDSEGISVKNDDGLLTVSGINDGESIFIYDISGALIGSATATAGTAIVNVRTSNHIVVLKIGKESIKVKL